MDLGMRLRNLRVEKGLTMDMLVYDMNTQYNIELNKSLVSRWENNINEPSLKYAAYLARYYDVSLDYLIGVTDCKTPTRLLAYSSKQMKELPVLKLPNGNNKNDLALKILTDDNNDDTTGDFF